MTAPEQLFAELCNEPRNLRIDDEDLFRTLVRLQLDTFKRVTVTRDDRWIIGGSRVTPYYAPAEQL